MTIDYFITINLITSGPSLTLSLQIDILVNNAGTLQIGLAEHTKLSVDEYVMDVNFLGVLSLTKAVLPHFLEKEDGHIAVISSPGGKLGKINYMFYRLGSRDDLPPI